MAQVIKLAKSKEKEDKGEAGSDRQVSVEEAVTQVIATMPRMFRTIKRQAIGSDAGGAASDLGETQVWVLYALASGAQLTGELARRFHVTTPTITRMVDGLVERGYVVRRHDNEDRRRIYLELTEAGVGVAQQSHERFRASLARFLSPLSERQLADIVVACGHLQTLLPDDGFSYSDLCPASPKSKVQSRR